MPLEYSSGKAPATETSQKTCHAYFIIAFEEKALSLMSRTNRPSFHSSNLIQRK